MMVVNSVLRSENRNLVRAKIRTGSLDFYVYILRRPNDTPFYVGKGKSDRLFAHAIAAVNTAEKSYKLNVIRAILNGGLQVRYDLESFHASEQSAHARERELIHYFGRHDLQRGPLTNLTDGGEGTSNPSEESKQRHRNTLYGDVGDDERSIANRFFAKLADVRSVPVKPAKFKALPWTPMKKKFTRPTPRMAAALAASAIANRVMLEPGCVIPRRLTTGGVEYLIENGVGKDILLVKLASLVSATRPEDEALRLDASAIAYITAAVGESILLDAGVLMPREP